MNALFRAALNVQQRLQDNDWAFCFIGGIALQYWGEPRLTRDLDLSIFTGFGGEEGVIDTLLTVYSSRISQPREFALARRILLLQDDDGIPLDISLGGLPFESRCVERSIGAQFIAGVTLRICSLEDLIVLKAFADRLRDWADLEGIILRQKMINWDQVFYEIAPLCDLKEAPEIPKKLSDLRSQREMR
ncbi:MAG: nucleotidyl transferase AbiEii/AbiGii toxin family protein [Candidatus Riflebacteria bacterium]|nr:nucleotidyl transferase AbiEii/AbiGii toxin family protein [Candidatus Riflebacteria bacterium]